jgi:hypothetical protein
VQWNRPFQVWEYTTSHAALLLRSLVEDQSPARVDVAFANVHAMQVRRAYDHLRIDAVEDFSSLLPASDYVRVRPSTQYFQINGGPDYVIAGAVSALDDEGTARKPSQFPLFRH